VSATTSGAGCGLVLGVVVVLLGQQFGFLTLSALLPALEYLVIGAIVGGILGALYGRLAGRKYRRPIPSRPAKRSEAPPQEPSGSSG
jgi:tetrahydromethanopterin S-methyltransferase subunit C